MDQIYRVAQKIYPQALQEYYEELARFRNVSEIEKNSFLFTKSDEVPLLLTTCLNSCLEGLRKLEIREVIVPGTQANSSTIKSSKQFEIFQEGYFGSWPSNPNHLELRSITEKDFEWIEESYVQNRSEIQAHDRLDLLKEVQACIVQEQTGFVAEENGVAVGFVIYLPFVVPFIGVNSAFVSDIYIKPQYRGRGLASKMHGNKISESIFGWALPQNESSLRQIQKTGRQLSHFHLDLR